MRRLAAVSAALAALAAGCGSQDQTQLVRAKLSQLSTATARKDYQTLCDQVFSKALVAKLRSVGLPCEVALETGLRDVRNPTLQVLHVDLSGKRASALVRSTATGQPPSTDTLELIREKGGWRVGSLAGAQAPRPRKPGPAS